MVREREEVPISRVHWPSCYRIIPSRFPPIDLFERVADAADLEAVIAIESLTNERVRDEVGELRLVAEEDRITGPGAGYIMAALTHVPPDGSRFADGTYGAYYAARDLATAVDETVYHRGRFLRATREGPMELDMRVLRARLDADLHDLRGMRNALRDIYDPDDYSASQALGRQLRAARSWGVVYESVRRPGGECVGVFRPKALSRCRQAQHLAYVWDGSAITTVYEKKILR
jgi:hypothetical protein